jgi:hypothetical protein
MVIILSIVMLVVIMLTVVMLNAVAPYTATRNFKLLQKMLQIVISTD